MNPALTKTGHPLRFPLPEGLYRAHVYSGVRHHKSAENFYFPPGTLGVHMELLSFDKAVKPCTRVPAVWTWLFVS